MSPLPLVVVVVKVLGVVTPPAFLLNQILLLSRFRSISARA